MKSHKSYTLLQLFLISILLFNFVACSTDDEKTTLEISLLDLLISIDDMPSGWRTEFPGDYITGSNYANETVKIVLVPKTGLRQASVQYIDRFSNPSEAKFRLHNDYIFERLNLGEFIPEEWVHPILSADEEKFFCYETTLDVSTEEFIQCVWTARYGEFIVKFISWVIPELMSLDQIKTIIVEIDGKMTEEIRK